MTDEGIAKSASALINKAGVYTLPSSDGSLLECYLCPGSDVLHGEAQRSHFNVPCKLCSLNSVEMY